MNRNTLIVFDLETTSVSPNTAEITQIAAVAIDNKKLTIVDKFHSYLKPEMDLALIEDGALAATRMTREQIAGFPETSIIWPQFVSFINKYNYKKSVYTAPIPCGYNIINYDMVIINRYCKKYKTEWDEKRVSQKMFSQVYKFDVLDHLWFWFESVPELEKLKLEEVYKYMGNSLAVENAHDAIVDVENTANLMIRLFKMQRYLTGLREDGTRRLEMKGCMSNG